MDIDLCTPIDVKYRKRQIENGKFSADEMFDAAVKIISPNPEGWVFRLKEFRIFPAENFCQQEATVIRVLREQASMLTEKQDYGVFFLRMPFITAEKTEANISRFAEVFMI